MICGDCQISQIRSFTHLSVGLMLLRFRILKCVAYLCGLFEREFGLTLITFSTIVLITL